MAGALPTRRHPEIPRTITRTTNGRVGEIARQDSRVYVDVTVRGSGNTINGEPITITGKDASVWALDLNSFQRGGGRR